MDGGRRRSAVVDVGCQRTGERLVARFVEVEVEPGPVWVLERVTRAAASAPAPPPGPALSGVFGFAGDYPGCPCCGAATMAFCQDCRRLGCSEAEAMRYRCWSCGSAGPLGPVAVEGLAARDLS